MLAELPPLTALILAYANRDQRHWQGLCWALDQRLAAVVRRGGEPTIAAIRLAWWDSVLVERDPAKGGGEPLVEAWRVAAPAGADAATEALIDGWRTLLGTESLSAEERGDYARKRGGGLFGLIAGDAGDALQEAGALWALWDLAGHSADPALAAAAMADAKALLPATGTLPRSMAPKPLRLLFAIAAADVRSGRIPRGFEARHYRALLWRSLLG